MNQVSKVLYISQEIYPYLPESEMAMMGRYLPQEVQEKGLETRTFMPKFGSINERRNQLHEVIRLSGMNLIIDDTDHPLIIKVASIQPARLQIYFIDNEDYFHRKYTVANENNEEYDDNDERTIFFARGVLETIKKLRWTPDVIHCQGWMSALVPLYIKKAYNDDPFFKHSKVVYAVFNDEFKKPFNSNFGEKLMIDGIQRKHIASHLKNQPIDYVALNKLAIDYSDGVIQASSTINEAVLEYILSTKTNFLAFESNDDYADKYIKFYNSL
ncbi:MAG TPA: glycogen/starch synthase [Paludibacteraceae bacterium]|nr:glycogen/starch synthase [Paludibacteraceae bacterium]HOL01118.1 glycogen/starch synthase [Paludibacteraceae bacterium]HPO67088.1 glycogen/starch synthase [Paludibacteraceae bacterium]HRR62362.1 glycogen/starch synthase [Paludibacteraceae bacterium]HRU63405.1 glycogen/starch synthase [Paludibacteraceae bacterium]